MTLNDLKAWFNQEGLRLTNQRKQVFEILLQANQPLNADDIYIQYLKNDEAISLSTVYRILELFVDKEMVMKTFMTDENKAYYAIKHGHKHYVTCLNCKLMMEIEDCPIHEIENAVENKTNFVVTTHKLELYGLCANCQ